MFKEKTFIKKYIEKDVLNSVDVFFAEAVLTHSASENQIFFLSYLFAITRLGHHCLTITDSSVSPYFISDQGFDKEDICKRLKEGAQTLPGEIMQEGSCSLNLKPIVKFKASYYLQKSFYLESKLIEKLRDLTSQTKGLFSLEEIEDKITLYQNNLSLDQRLAIKNSLGRPFSFLTGGPGTGKTYTAAYLLKIFEKLCLDKNIKPKIAISAPTGKAAFRLQESLVKSGFDLEAKAMTLHQLLDIKQKQDFYKNRRQLDYDLILVDEASMIDLELFSVLLHSINQGSFILFLGDPHQLPPVESGTVFSELALSDQKLVNVSSLKTCVRTDNKELIAFANRILLKQDMDFNEYKDSSTLTFLDAKNPKQLHQFLEDQIAQRLREKIFQPLGIDLDYEKLFSAFSSHKFLSPFLEGIWGVNAINKKCLDKQLSCIRPYQRYALPLIITKNDYDLGLFNGVEGVYIKHIEEDPSLVSEKDFVIFKSSEGYITWPISQLKAYSLAYALTVHKSQGSEYGQMSLFLPKGSESFGVEMLYTAITRAKERITCLMYDFSLRTIYEKSNLKETNLISRFFV